MGPDLYGRFAVQFALVGLLIFISGFGAVPTFGRFVAEFPAKGERWKIEILFAQMFWLRTLLALVFTAVFPFVFPRILPGASRFMIVTGALALAAGAVGATCYMLFFGLNALGKWLSYEAPNAFHHSACSGRGRRILIEGLKCYAH